MRTLRILGVFSLLFLLFIEVNAQTQEKPDTSTLRLSLEEAKKFAIENNYSVKMSQLDLKSAKEKIWETTAIGLPQVTGSVTYQNIFKVPEIAFGGPTTTVFDAQGLVNDNAVISSGSDLSKYVQTYPTPKMALGVKENVTGTITVSQLIFSGEYLVGLKASRTYYKLADLSAQKSQSDVIENVQNSYYAAIILTENYKILKDLHKSVVKLLADMTGMNNAGFLEESDVDQIKINKNNLELNLGTLEQNLVFLNKLLKFQLGVNLDRKLILTDSINTIAPVSSMNGYFTENFKLDNNLDYKLLQTNVTASELLLKQQKSKYLPTLAGYYRYQKLMDEPAFNMNPPHVVGLSLDIPIFSSFQRNSRVKQASYSLDKSKLQLEMATTAMNINHQQMLLDLQKYINTYYSTEESRDFAKKIYDKTCKKFAVGMATSLELEQTQSQYIQKDGDFYSAFLNVMTTKIKIDKLLGKY